EGESLAELVVGKLHLLKNLACFKLNLPEGRMAVFPGAFVKHTIAEFKTLRKGFRIVRKAIDDRKTELFGCLIRHHRDHQVGLLHLAVFIMLCPELLRTKTECAAIEVDGFVAGAFPDELIV